MVISGSTFAPQTLLWLLTSDLSHTCFSLTPPTILTDSDFFTFCLFIWTVHNLIIVFSHFILHIIKSNCFGLPHCKSLESSSDSGFAFFSWCMDDIHFCENHPFVWFKLQGMICRHRTKCLFSLFMICWMLEMIYPGLYYIPFECIFHMLDVYCIGWLNMPGFFSVGLQLCVFVWYSGTYCPLVLE